MNIDALIKDTARLARRAMMHGWDTTTTRSSLDDMMVQTFRDPDMLETPAVSVTRGPLYARAAVDNPAGVLRSAFGDPATSVEMVNSAIGRIGVEGRVPEDWTKAGNMVKKAVLNGWDVRVRHDVVAHFTTVEVRVPGYPDGPVIFFTDGQVGQILLGKHLPAELSHITPTKAGLARLLNTKVEPLDLPRSA